MFFRRLFIFNPGSSQGSHVSFGCHFSLIFHVQQFHRLFWGGRQGWAEVVGVALVDIFESPG